MCGVAGLWLLDAELTEEDLRARVERMGDALRHRGPDSSGEWADARSGLGLAHRRLSIIDLSAEGHQPMVSADGRWVISFNGEIYNYRALGKELEATGVRFHGASDTEVLLEAIGAWGLDRTLPRLEGMFAFSLWDRANQTLSLVRDRLGIKPLSWGHAGNDFCFGSELHALRTLPSFDTTLDPVAVGHFIRFGFIQAPHTIHQRATKVQPGTYVEVTRTDGRFEVTEHSYWDLLDVIEGATGDPFRGDRGDAADCLDELLTRSVEMRMVSDVPLGAFLSGGYDSTAVVAKMQELASDAVKTFTIGFDSPEFDESPHAATVARALGTEHTSLRFSTDDLVGQVGRMSAVFDEPFADPSQLPTLLLAGLTRSHVTVSLSGDGGDEVFGGYRRYQLADRIRSAGAFAPAGLRALIGGGIGAVPQRAWDLVRWFSPILPAELQVRSPGSRIHRAARLLAYRTLPELYEELMAHWRPSELDEMGVRPPGSTWPALAEGDPRDVVLKSMYTDARTYLPDDILVKVDRTSMAESLEARVPLLDPALVAFGWSLPAAWRRKDGGKTILKDLVHRSLPVSVMERPKQGFGIPQSELLRGPLRHWGEEILDGIGLEARGLRWRPVRDAWELHQRGDEDKGYGLWNALMLASWELGTTAT